jgi:hypothetical protein
VEAIVPHRVAVSPLARGQGVASAFFAQAEMLARVRLCYRRFVFIPSLCFMPSHLRSRAMSLDWLVSGVSGRSDMSSNFLGHLGVGTVCVCV